MILKPMPPSNRTPDRAVDNFKRFTLIAFSLFLMAGIAKAAPAPGNASNDYGNLGDLLLDDELARSLAPAPPAPALSESNPAAQGKPDWLPNPDALNRMLEQGAREAAGEDVGSSPLASVVSGMRRAEGLIRTEGSKNGAAPVQREVVAQLEKLIAEMEKQCQNCNKSSKDQKKQASKRSKPKPGECKPGECKPGDKPGKPSNKKGDKANKSGTTSLAGAPNASTPEEQQQLIKAAWGHLPERMREQMLQGSDSEFLPEYRNELQDYYRRLAERSSREAP